MTEKPRPVKGMSGCREQARSNVYAVRLAPTEAPSASTGRSTLRVLVGVGRNACSPVVNDRAGRPKPRDRRRSTCNQ